MKSMRQVVSLATVTGLLTLGGLVAPLTASAGDLQASAASVTPAAIKSPSGVSTASSATRIAVEWNKVSGATSYKVRVRTSSGTTLAVKTVKTLAHKFYGLKPSTEYVIAVASIDSKGQGSYSTGVKKKTKALAKADRISTPTVSGVTNTTATVSWTGVADADTYEVEVLKGSALIRRTSMKVVKSYNELNPTKVTLTGLPQYSNLTARVRGVNAAGSSSWSPTRGFPTLATKINPKDVGKPSVSAITTTTAQASWRAVPYAHSYVVTVFQGSKAVRSWTTTATSRVLDRLSPGGSYTVKVTARNTTSTAVGAGASFVTVPGAVTNVKVGYRDSKAVISWNAVVGADDYMIKITDAKGEILTTLLTAKLSVVPYSLPDNQTLYASVAAWNRAGGGVYSAPVKIVLPPKAPSGLNVTSIGLDRAVVSWNQPATKVLGFKVIVRDKDARVVFARNVPGNASSVQVTGLAWNTRYTVQLSSVGAGGESSFASRTFTTNKPASLRGTMTTKAVRTSKSRMSTTVNITVPGVQEGGAYRPVSVTYRPSNSKYSTQTKQVTLKYDTKRRAYVGTVAFSAATGGLVSLTGNYVSAPSVPVAKIIATMKVSKFKKTSKTLSGKIYVKNGIGTTVKVQKKVGFKWKTVKSFKVKKNSVTFTLKQSAKKHKKDRYWKVILPANDTATGGTTLVTFLR